MTSEEVGQLQLKLLEPITSDQELEQLRAKLYAEIDAQWQSLRDAATQLEERTQRAEGVLAECERQRRVVSDLTDKLLALRVRLQAEFSEMVAEQRSSIEHMFDRLRAIEDLDDPADRLAAFKQLRADFAASCTVRKPN